MSRERFALLSVGGGPCYESTQKRYAPRSMLAGSRNSIEEEY
jgi:hypothetical protein